MTTIIGSPRINVPYYAELDVRGARIKGKSARTGNWETIDKFWLWSILESIESELSYGKPMYSDLDGLTYAELGARLRHYLKVCRHECIVIRCYGTQR